MESQFHYIFYYYTLIYKMQQKINNYYFFGLMRVGMYEICCLLLYTLPIFLRLKVPLTQVFFNNKRVIRLAAMYLLVASSNSK